MAPLVLAGQLGRLLAQFLGLIGQRRDLVFHVIGVQRRQLLGILGAHQLLGEFERRGDIALGKPDGHFADLLGTAARSRSMSLGGVDRVLRGGDETVEGLLGLLHAFLSERAHFRRDLEIRTAFLRHNILLIGGNTSRADLNQYLGSSTSIARPGTRAIKVIAAWWGITSAASWTEHQSSRIKALLAVNRAT